MLRSHVLFKDYGIILKDAFYIHSTSDRSDLMIKSDHIKVVMPFVRLLVVVVSLFKLYRNTMRKKTAFSYNNRSMKSLGILGTWKLYKR